MIKIDLAREQSAMPQLESVKERIDGELEVIVDKAIMEAYGEHKFETFFDYADELLDFLEKNYRKEGYKIKVICSEGFRDGGYPQQIKLSWYPKQ